MVDSSIIQSMIEYASFNSGDVVLDIGAGLGFLTRSMASKCGTVLAVESDTNLVKILRHELADLSNVKIIHGDVFKVEVLPFNKVVSIPPYHISSQLLLWLFRQEIDCSVLILQREFANRLVAPVGSEGYGWLTVVAYYYEEFELLDVVPKWMFYPQPKVNSIIVCLKPTKPAPFTLKNETLFKQMTQSLFTRRNRKVRNAVSTFTKSAHVKSAEFETIPFLDKRVRELAPEDFGVLSNAITK